MFQRAANFNWVLEPWRFLSDEEARRLLETARTNAGLAVFKGRKTPMRDYLVVDIGLSTGLRVMEIAQLNCEDVFMRDGICSLLVRRGKGGKKRLVRFGESLSRHVTEYLRWKKTVGEPTGPHDPLLLSGITGRHMTTRAIRKAFKRTAAKAGLPERYSIHCLRHTYACQLYKASGHNLRLVQKQLGHSSIRTTEVYADVMEPDIEAALGKLYTQASSQQSWHSWVRCHLNEKLVRGLRTAPCSACRFPKDWRTAREQAAGSVWADLPRRLISGLPAPGVRASLVIHPSQDSRLHSRRQML